MTRHARPTPTSTDSPGWTRTDAFYRAFEERFRGSRELISERLLAYLPFLEPLKAVDRRPAAVDLGCGRGEWLELLAASGFDAKGIDLDDGMLSACSERGLPAQKGDAVAFLEQIDDESLAIVSGFHIAEHLPFPRLEALVRQASRVLKPGGLLILETPNPENFHVASLTFYYDPTHRKPLPPALLAFLTEYHGFARSKIVRLQESRELLHAQTALLGDVLGGASQDYAVVAQKPAVPAVARLFDGAFDKEFGLPASVLIERFDRHLLAQKELTRELTARLEAVEMRLQEKHKARAALAVQFATLTKLLRRVQRAAFWFFRRRAGQKTRENRT
jgi:O-antigen chain-terminating methyltransferase